MDAMRVQKIVKGVLRRIAHRTRIRVLRAHCRASEVTCPEGFTLVRARGTSAGATPSLIESAMREAGEPSGLVTPRLAHGDEFFGWLSGNRIVSFGWVCHSDRSVGPAHLTETAGRAFLFNFHTAVAHRGRGLYPSLLIAMQNVLASEGLTELIIDVNVLNTVSARAIARAGFAPVGHITYTTILGRWQHMHAQPPLDLAGPLLC